MRRDRYRWSWVGWAALTLFSACSDDDELSCGEGTEKQDDVCVAVDGDGTEQMADAGTCGEGTFDSDGTCLPISQIGDPCTTSSECESGACLKEAEGTPGGYCTQLSCSASRPCPGGSHCMFSAANDTNLCLATCDSSDSCREGYVCQPRYTSDYNVCIPDCRIASFCTTSTICDEDDGLCKPVACDPTASDDSCGDERACAPNAAGVGDSAGLCLLECSSEDDCSTGEVCQPLTADPAGLSVCAPPVCDSDEACPAGSHCTDSACIPPARCDDEGACADEAYRCIGGPSGTCMPACPDADEGGCGELHSGLSCSESYGACLPTGDFPGSPCRADKNDACGGVAAGDASIAMTCLDDVCMVPCGGAADVCTELSTTLTCAVDILNEDVCLPKGSFPGAPCGTDNSCDDIELESGSATMSCVQDACVIDCEAGGEGDKSCAAIDGSLVCAAGVGPDGSDVCLPRGSYPGGPCGPGDECADGLFCSSDDICLTDCTSGGNTLCSAVHPDLVCATGIYDGYDACLPKGSFPGGPCAHPDGQQEGVCTALQLPGGEAQQVCVQDVCALACEVGGSGDAYCTAVQEGLLCANVGAAVGACLPQGTYYGSPCDGDAPCSGDPSLVCDTDSNSCAVGCDSSDEATGNGYCTSVGSALGTGFNACEENSATVEICTSPPPT